MPCQIRPCNKKGIPLTSKSNTNAEVICANAEIMKVNAVIRTAEIGSSAVAGGISGRVADDGGGRLKSFLKWSAHCFLYFSSLLSTLSSLSFNGFVCVDLFHPR
ncbi:unnamed protein product [Heterobilharzia americana]|nr:unnamed protein product [Heterobilharzia americana]